MRYIGGTPKRAIGTTPLKPRIYLDHAATTPMRPEAVAAVAEGMARWANPSSPHAEGRAARAALEDARTRIRTTLGWTGEVIFTGGASEAIALAFAGGDVTMSATEHDAVLRAAKGAPILPVDGRGIASMANGRAAIQSANSETGVLQPQDHRYFADCSQSAGKLPLPEADLIAVSAHKLGGPPGIGVLLVRDLGLLVPTGGQERGYRGGTENLPGALGFAAALEAPGDWFAAMPAMRARLDAAIVAGGGEIVGGTAPRIPTIASYRMPGVSAASQLIRFDMGGIAVSAGSACSSGSLRPSHVLAAMGWDAVAASEVVRVSFGWTTTEAEVDRFIDAWLAIAHDATKRVA